jgi:hypothetical protein
MRMCLICREFMPPSKFYLKEQVCKACIALFYSRCTLCKKTHMSKKEFSISLVNSSNGDDEFKGECNLCILKRSEIDGVIYDFKDHDSSATATQQKTTE